MDLFQIISAESGISLDAKKCKVHLASWGGEENPLDTFIAGKFQEFQEAQNLKNFGRKYIISMIKLHGEDLWLFAGVYESFGVFKKEKDLYLYSTKLVEKFSTLSGRLLLKYRRPSRQSYPYGESIKGFAEVDQILSKPISIERFTGYDDIFIAKSVLRAIIRDEIADWKSALSAISGVYLVTDSTTGKLYVGSAYGEQGIWGRWLAYDSSGHAGNKELKKLLSDKGVCYADSFKFSVLQIMDIKSSSDEVIKQESRWKERLGSRLNGYNSN